MALARVGDDRAFTVLYQRHVSAAVRHARKVVPNPADADEAVARAFAATFTAIQNGQGPSESFRAYIATAARHAAVGITRPTRVHAERPTAELPEPTAPASELTQVDVGDGPARQAFAELPERWQLVLWRTEVEGYGPGELAGSLGMSANAVAGLARRARVGFQRGYLHAVAGPDVHAWVRAHASAAPVGFEHRQALELHLAECESCRLATGLTTAPARTSLAGVLLGGAVFVPGHGRTAPFVLSAAAGAWRALRRWFGLGAGTGSTVGGSLTAKVATIAVLGAVAVTTDVAPRPVAPVAAVEAAAGPSADATGSPTANAGTDDRADPTGAAAASAPDGPAAADQQPGSTGGAPDDVEAPGGAPAPATGPGGGGTTPASSPESTEAPAPTTTPAGTPPPSSTAPATATTTTVGGVVDEVASIVTTPLTLPPATVAVSVSLPPDVLPLAFDANVHLGLVSTSTTTITIGSGAGTLGLPVGSTLTVQLGVSVGLGTVSYTVPSGLSCPGLPTSPTLLSISLGATYTCTVTSALAAGATSTITQRLGLVGLTLPLLPLTALVAGPSGSTDVDPSDNVASN